jgi:hypothetical protein
LRPPGSNPTGSLSAFNAQHIKIDPPTEPRKQNAHLKLAKLARARNDKPAALEHAREAHRLATCDGPPDYTYKAAYDEAAALLTDLGEPP